MTESNSKFTSDRNDSTKPTVIHGKNRKSEERDRKDRRDKRRSRDSSLRFVDMFVHFKLISTILTSNTLFIFIQIGNSCRRKSNRRRSSSRNRNNQYNRRWRSRSKTKFFNSKNAVRESSKAGTPKAGTPKAGTPKAGTPKAETSKTEQPKGEIRYGSSKFYFPNRE